MKLSAASPLQKLIDTLPQQGTVNWIGVRTARKAPVIAVDEVTALTEQGLNGDHYAAKAGSKRQITLIQQEDLDAIASMMQLYPLTPEMLRRNLVIHGINLQALKDKIF